MNKAQEVKKQIDDLYGIYGNHIDIARHLTNDNIDVGVPSIHKHNGFNNSDALYVFYYSDNSMLVIGTSIDASGTQIPDDEEIYLERPGLLIGKKD
jgi:hypothetical protein